MSNGKVANGTAMRVSAIRFGTDLWRVLEAEAARAGVSVSQYVREAALARASAALAARGEDPLEALALAVHEAPTPVAGSAEEPRARERDEEPLVSSAHEVRSHAQEVRSGAQAVRAQSRQISRHAREVTRKERPSER